MLESNLWRVYLSGEIHSDWRNEIKSGIEQSALPVQLTAPVIDHASSDDCDVDVLGPEDDQHSRNALSVGFVS